MSANSKIKQGSETIKVRALAKRSEDHHYPHLTGYEIRYFYEVFPSLNEVDFCVMMGLTAFAFGTTETSPTRGALATFVNGKTLESRKQKITRSLKRLEDAGALEVFTQSGSASVYDITLFNARTFDYAKSQGWFDTVKFNPTLINSDEGGIVKSDNTPLSNLITLKNQQEDVTDKEKDSTATAKTADVGGTVDPPKSEPNEKPEANEPETQDTPSKESMLTEILASEENVDRRLAVAKTVIVPPRPSETVTGGKFVKGLTKTEWFMRLEEILTAFTDAPGFKLRQTSTWLVKETDYDIPDLLSAWQWVRKHKPELNLPYSVTNANRGLCWAFSEWEKSKPVKIAPPPVDDDYEVFYVPGGTVRLHKVRDAEKIAELKAVS